MSKKDALTIIRETEVDFKQKQRILRGFEILAKYDDDITCSFEHDILYIDSDFEESVAKMTREDVIEMAILGWFMDNECETWAHF